MTTGFRNRSLNLQRNQIRRPPGEIREDQINKRRKHEHGNDGTEGRGFDAEHYR